MTVKWWPNPASVLGARPTYGIEVRRRGFSTRNAPSGTSTQGARTACKPAVCCVSCATPPFSPLFCGIAGDWFVDLETVEWVEGG